MAKTMEFSVNFSFVYGTSYHFVDTLTECFLFEAKKEKESGGVFVDANVVASKMTYEGAPDIGLSAAFITGVCNPEVCEDVELWKKSVINVVTNLIKGLKEEGLYRFHAINPNFIFREVEYIPLSI